MSIENEKHYIIIRKLSRPGCRPCAILSNYLDELQEKITKEGAKVSEHDITVENDLIDKYKISSVPVLIFERNGVEMSRLTGLVGTGEILESLKYAKVAK